MSAVNWHEIDCVFLDMDGTLLDLNYDNHVWNDLVPQAYALKTGLTNAAAKEKLLAHMSKIRGSIEFYSFEYWVNYTGIDLIAAHQQATELVAYRPGALAFLRWLRGTSRHTVIATNAHPDSINVKDAHADICSEVDAVVSSHHYSAPKESKAFWQALLQEHPFEPRRCLFIDDNEPVLDAAAKYGIGHLLVVSRPDSARPTRSQLRYPSFDDFAEICPAIIAETTTPSLNRGPEQNAIATGVRIDRWLWAARFFKTRSLAKVAVEAGHIQIEGLRAKPAKEVHIGHTLRILRGSQQITVVVAALAAQRGPAKIAQTLYTETDESIEQREIQSSRRRMERAGLRVPQSKPSKKDRRDLRKLKSLDGNWQEST